MAKRLRAEDAEERFSTTEDTENRRPGAANGTNLLLCALCVLCGEVPGWRSVPPCALCVEESGGEQHEDRSHFRTAGIPQENNAGVCRGGRLRRHVFRHRPRQKRRKPSAGTIPVRTLGKTGLKLPDPRLRRRGPAQSLAQSAVVRRPRGTGPLCLRPRPALLRHGRQLHGKPGDPRRGAQRPASRRVSGDESRDHATGSRCARRWRNLSRNSRPITWTSS